jgi:hypothetical protein
MSVRACHIIALTALALAGAMLGGCSSMNQNIGPAIGQALPLWAGGEPNDVPPRKGTPEYDAYMKEREQKWHTPASPSGPASSSPTQPGAVHY